MSAPHFVTTFKRIKIGFRNSVRETVHVARSTLWMACGLRTRYRSSASVFRIKLHTMWILWSGKYIFLIMKINNFQGVGTDATAKNEALYRSCARRRPRHGACHVYKFWMTCSSRTWCRSYYKSINVETPHQQRLAPSKNVGLSSTSTAPQSWCEGDADSEPDQENGETNIIIAWFSWEG